MEQQETLGKRIAALRKNQGWTQEQLGEKVGVSAQAVSKWENDIACPDIATLPLLASLFGITTDELLGVKQVDPHVVVLDKEPNTGNGEIHVNFQGKPSVWGTVSFCITAILICLMFILKGQTSLFNRPDIATWNYVWPLLVFGIGLMQIRSNLVFGIAAILIGIYEFIWFGWGVPFEIQWYVIVLILAIAYLIKILLKKLGLLPQKKSAGVENLSGSRIQKYSDADDYIRTELSFSSSRIVYPRERLKGMDLETNFGSYVVDLTSVREFCDAVLNYEVNFGNVVILLPKSVQLARRNAETALGALKVTGNPDEFASQTVYLRGEVNFGNLEIRYPD